MVQGDSQANNRANFYTFTNYFGDLYGDYWGLNVMRTTGEIIDVIPQVSKRSHYPPPPPPRGYSYLNVNYSGKDEIRLKHIALFLTNLICSGWRTSSSHPPVTTITSTSSSSRTLDLTQPHESLRGNTNS